MEPVLEESAVTLVDPTASTLITLDQAVRESQFLLTESVRIHFELGRRLAWIKEHTERGQFLRILNEDLAGLPKQRAYEHILFYSKVQQFPRLRDMAEANFSKALLLFNNLPDEEIRLIEAGEHATLKPDIIELKGVRELRQEILDLRKQNKEIADTERARHRTEIESLEKQVGDLEGELAAARQETPEAKELKRMAGEISDLVSKLGKKVGELSRLPHTPDMDVPTRAAIEGQLATALRLAQGAHSRFIGLFVMDD